MNTESTHIEIIMRQTTYSSEEALQNYIKNDRNYIKTIKEFMNIKDVEKNDTIQKSINQEIYKAMREKLEISPEKRDLISNKKIVSTNP